MVHFSRLKSAILDYFRSKADLTEREQYFISIDVYGGYVVYQKSVSDGKDYELDLERVRSGLGDRTDPWLDGVFNPDGDIFVRDTISNCLNGMTPPAAKNVWFEEVFLQDLYWNYEPIQRLSQTAQKVVSFYSFRDGTGRTTALLLTAIAMARMGKKVVLVDFDLESAGFFRFFSKCQLPEHGVLDYLVDRWVYNKASTAIPIEDYLLSATDLCGEAMDGAIYVVPACGTELLYNPNDYLRVLMHTDLDLRAFQQYKITPIDYLFSAIHDAVSPDYILVDSRSGFHQIAGILMNRYSSLSLFFSSTE